MRQALLWSVLILILCGIVLALSMQQEVVQSVSEYVKTSNTYASYGAYVLLLIVAVVCMPLTVWPLVPVISAIFGPFVTGVLNVIGFTVGAMAAFLIARYVGKPVLKKFVSLKKLDEIAATIPENSRFIIVILLRLTLPIDIVSYALGLTKSLSFASYSIATCIGVIWFSFAYAYLGKALLEGNLVVAAQLLLASLVIFFIGWYLLRRSNKTKK